jgi:hypothetical protein
MQRLAVAGATAAAVISLFTGVASASTFTIGSTAEPSDATEVQACGPAELFAQSAGGAFAASAGGEVTQWQTNTAGETPGTSITLVAMTPAAGLYRIDAADTESVPSPAGGVATFTPKTPMLVSAGDILGLAGGTGATCSWFESGGTNQTQFLAAGVTTLGQVFSPLGAVPGAVNVSATISAVEDSSVTTTLQPSTVSAGGTAVLASTVTDNGPASNPLTFTDAVATGLTIDTVLSPSGTCTTAGQVVTCTITGLAAGQSAPVDVLVTAKAGKYTNQVTVTQASIVTDPTTANNTATEAFTAAAATKKCAVTGLAKVPLATAKKVLTALSCKVGKVTKAYSSTVAKGDVIKTTPGSGSYTSGKSIGISESNGPKPKPKKKKKK